MSDETKKTQETELSDEQLEKAAGGTDAIKSAPKDDEDRTVNQSFNLQYLGVQNNMSRG